MRFLLLFSLVLGFIAFPVMAQPSIYHLPEMEPLPITHLGELDETCSVTEEEQDRWQQTYDFVTGTIDTKLIVSLSRWAIEETKGFVYEPQPTLLNTWGCNDQYVLYSSQLAELPSHHPLVRRYLMVFIVGVREPGYFLPNGFYITIRGEKFE